MAFEPIGLSSVKRVCKPDCPDRSWDCHVRCEKYKAYRAECDKEIQDRYQKKQIERDIITEISAAIKRLGHGRGH